MTTGTATTPPRSVLIVEDDRLMARSLRSHFARRFKVHISGTLSDARACMASEVIDLVLLDLHLPDGDGLDLLREIPTEGGPPVIIMTAFPKVRSAVIALQSGAFDYLTKPFELDELDLVVERALGHGALKAELAALRRQVTSGRGADALIGDSSVMQQLRALIRQVAQASSSTVLLRGESGTGKQVAARAIHEESPRAAGPLVELDCTAIPENLIESELFGHERGAYTGAGGRRRGVVEQAHRGTLFLDEIGDMPLSLQARLLRLLENRRFRRVGGDEDVSVDVRFVAATNRPLEQLVADGGFRKDLLYRLRVVELTLPPLREHLDDLNDLCAAFIARLAPEVGRVVRRLDPACLDDLRVHTWPGNVRELRNLVERALILGQGTTLTLRPLGPLIDSQPPGGARLCFPDDLDQLPTLDELSRAYTRHVCERTGGNKSRAAEILGVSRVTVRQKLLTD